MTQRLKTIVCVLILLAGMSAKADVITLRSGQRVEGSILVQNADILIVKTSSGARFQYPMAEVVKIDTSVVKQDTVVISPTERKSKPVAIRLSVDAGGAFVPNYEAGGGLAVDAAIGTRDLAGKGIFLGGSIGYFGAYTGSNHHFIPLQAVVGIPLASRVEVPELMIGLGYGFGTGKSQGGVAATLRLIWSLYSNASTKLLLGASLRFQQGDRNQVETIDGVAYSRNAGAVYLLTGVSMALQF